MLKRTVRTVILIIIYMIRKREQHPAGFTLVEFLVVIGIILIASSVILINTTGGSGSALSASQRIVSGIAQGARGQAILKGATTRLIIYSDNNIDDDKKLRFFGIVYQDENDSSLWSAATQGTYLPEGIYFDPDMSLNNGFPKLISRMNLEYPRLTPQPLGGEEYYFYEFESNGTAAFDWQNAWLVLRAGALKPSPNGSNNLKVNFEDEQLEGLKSALILRRSGTTTKVNDPELITN
jgi:prepilin-type N-terminal cleavage/methylation domain-containing protein